MSSSKTIDLQRDFAAGVWGPEPHTPPPPVYVCTVHLLTQRKGAGGIVEPERRLEGNSSQSWVENTNGDWLYFQSVNSDKHLPQSPSTGKNFLDNDILLWCLYS